MAQRRKKGGKGNVANATPLLGLDALLSNELVRELAGLEDEREALRRVVLHCILLLQDNDERAVRNFCTMLLTRFPPIADKFVRHRHPFFKRVEVMRAETVDGAVTLVLPLERLAKTLGLPIPGDDA